VQPLGVREPDDFNGVFEAMDRDPPDAIFMVADVLTTLNRKRMFDYAGALAGLRVTDCFHPVSARID
jgi:putative tryptophan/tyrosine transport system substrate-binding protein